MPHHPERPSGGTRLRSLRLAMLLLAAGVLAAPQCPERPLACEEPLEGLGGIAAETLDGIRTACPACPYLAQARYADHDEYVDCVGDAIETALDAGELGLVGALRVGLRALFAPVANGAPPTTLLPGRGENGFDPELAQHARQYDRQFGALNAAPFGMSLDAHIGDANARAAVDAFLADPMAGDTPEAFAAATGLDVFDAIDEYGEVGDLGMFGGVAAAGDAFRYAALRASCDRGVGGCGSLPAARDRLRDILDAMHVAHAITGPDGVIVRGLAPRDMPFRPLVALPPFDPSVVTPPTSVRTPDGEPNPGCFEKPSNPTGGPSQRLRIREDATQTTPGDPASGDFPDWLWMDNASKDQLTGWVYAMGAVYDVVRDDPAFDAARVQRLSDDAATMGARLMRVSPPLGLDMTIVDGDGCATTFHDLHADEFEGLPIATVTAIILGLGGNRIPAETRAKLAAYKNGFNALLGLATMRTLCHVSRDADVCDFYYDELVDGRDWPGVLVQDPIPTADIPPDVQDFLASSGLVLPPTLSELGSLPGVDFAEQTNYSNVNMAFIGFYGLLRYEPDPALRALYRQSLVEALWDTGASPRQPRVLAQSFFDFLFAGLSGDATALEPLAGASRTLAEFPAPPYWNDRVENCDADELSALSCIAVDGETPIAISPEAGRNGAIVAVDVLPKRLRPPSNYEWRSNPYVPNGGGGDRLNPGGDFRGAYWLGRFLERGAENLAEGTLGR